MSVTGGSPTVHTGERGKAKARTSERGKATGSRRRQREGPSRVPVRGEGHWSPPVTGGRPQTHAGDRQKDTGMRR